MPFPKSNSTYVAIDAALSDIRAGKSGDVPDHLKDSHYSGAKELGRGIDYKYPHSFPGAWVNQQYLPDKLKNAVYFEPNHTGKYEDSLARQYDTINKMKRNPDSS